MVVGGKEYGGEWGGDQEIGGRMGCWRLEEEWGWRLGRGDWRYKDGEAEGGDGRR